jgi:YidC/Oxa1 family membrane protein insertase
MDRNSVIGLILIAAILIGYSVWTSPTQEEIEAAKRKNDSIQSAQIEQQRIEQELNTAQIPDEAKAAPDEIQDSLAQQKIVEQFGVFANAAQGINEYFTLENEKVIIKLSNQGGRIVSVELKEYKSYDSLPLILFTEEHSSFGFDLIANNKKLFTGDLYFEPIGTSAVISGDEETSITMRLAANEDTFVDFVYNLKGNSYLVDFYINFKNFQNIVAPQENLMMLRWDMFAPITEKSLENQRMNTTIYFNYVDDFDYLSETKDDRMSLEKPAQWVALKQQFFSSVLISDTHFEKDASVLESKTEEESTDHVKLLSANLALPFKHTPSEAYQMKFYFGPNHYPTLSSIGYDLQKIIPLGWGIFGWVNKFIVIPVFNFLKGFDMNIGIVILLLTIFIKLILSPFTYKAYLSTAKMRVLKPEIEELNKKHANDDPLKKQQAVMALYKKAGVNPLGGCIPMLLQFPILIAMFRFFPASIELRQESFLWADDLSTYDSIMNLSFNIPFYGDHVSLFTILMTISTIIYTRMNSQFSSSPEMAQMKWMMYLMPIVFLGIFNNYAAGLSYYYFLANIITFTQQFAMQKLVDEKALLAKIEEYKKRPESQKKSSFQKRLEDAAKKRGYKLPK